MRKVLGLVVLGLTVAGCGADRGATDAAARGAAPATTAPATATTTADAGTTMAAIVTTTEATTTAIAQTEAPVVLTADGANVTAPFRLAGGTYKSTWQTFGPHDCYHGGKLNGGTYGTVMTAQGITQGETYVYDVEPGEYYVEVFTGPSPNCRWQITLTPA